MKRRSKLPAWQRIVLVLLALIWFTPAAVAQRREPRLALVIANGAYASFDKLSATYTDGDAISAALNTVGFVDASGTGPVRPRRDVNQATLLAEVEAFKAQLAKAGPTAMGVLYFSGHGAAMGSFGDVVMLPIDAGKSGTLEQQALSRATVTKNLLGSGAKTVLIVLDMCRNVVSEPPRPADAALVEVANIVPVSADGTATRGLRRITRQEDATRPDQGFLVAFSTSPDHVAFDDGAFSRVLAEEIRRPQQDIATAMKRVSDRVAMQPGRSAPQKPTFDYGLQGQPPCFVSCDLTAGTDRFYDCANCPWMRVVPPGEGIIGSPATETGRKGNEPLARPVKMDKPFAMGIFEVTVAEWAACVRDKACSVLPNWLKENANQLIPASHITLADAQAYVGWLSSQSGKTYRLPTDEEWEYADRAGSSSIFPFGDDISPAMANYDHTARYRNSAPAPYRGYPAAPQEFAPNGFGLYQMQGNMWEWTAGRELRGGSFQSAPAELRSANRFAAPASRRADVGLRVVRDLRPDEVSQ